MHRLAIFGLGLLIAVGLSLADADAAKRKRWRDFNAQERTQLMKVARQACRKKFGAIIDRVVIDYYKEQIVCWRG